MSEPMTPAEFEAWQADMRSCRGPSEEEIRADERRKVAEEIAAEIDTAGEKAKAYHYKAAMSRAARIAREIGEARDSR